LLESPTRKALRFPGRAFLFASLGLAQASGSRLNTCVTISQTASGWTNRVGAPEGCQLPLASGG